MERNELQQLLRHMEWADALTWRSVTRVGAAPPERRLRELLYHVHTVQWVYLQLWRGEPPSVPEFTTFNDLQGIAVWARPYYPAAYAFADSIAGPELAQELAIPWAAEVGRRYGSAGPATLGETVLQVVLHSTYHRAQVAARVRELGGEPDTTDFIAWVWQRRPAAQW